MLSITSLAESVGQEAFAEACREAHAGKGLADSDVPHRLSDRLWYDGNESLADRLRVAIELYQRMPGYGHLMYWRHADFDDATQQVMWDAYRDFLGDDRGSVAEPAAYSLWVDYFEDPATVARAWQEVAGPQEPRRPRLERVLGASGPVPWALKAPLYEKLANEGGWDEPLLEGLYGSCIDIYGSLDRVSAQRLLGRLDASPDDERFRILRRALSDPDLPDAGTDRREFVARLAKSS